MGDLTLVVGGEGGKGVKYVLGCGLYFVYYVLGDKGLAFHDKLVTGLPDNPNGEGKGRSPWYVG